jgi:hypothetical protein
MGFECYFRFLSESYFVFVSREVFTARSWHKIHGLCENYVTGDDSAQRSACAIAYPQFNSATAIGCV